MGSQPYEDFAELAHECELLVRAEAASEMLSKASTLSRFDEDNLRRGLDIARDVYERLEHHTRERQGEVRPEVKQAMQSLARLTLRSYPVLLHAVTRAPSRSLH
jgi:hypothetical protein